MPTKLQVVTPHHTEKSQSCVAVIAERRYLSQSQPSGMIDALKGQGHSVLVIDPEENTFTAQNLSWTQGIDVVVARGRSWGVLLLLEWLERRGIRSVNSRSAIAAVHNKAEMTVALASAGIPIPRTVLGRPQHIAPQLAADDFPVIVKPVFGDNCRGLEVVYSRDELAALRWPDPLAIVQKFIPGAPYDLKLYCIGREVWAVRKPSPLIGAVLPGQAMKSPELAALTPAWEKLARRCGEVFGLELFGVDCIETEDGLVVIEVNEFPNYSSVPGADEKLSNYVVASTRQEN